MEAEKKMKLDWTDLSMDAKWIDVFTEEVVPDPGDDPEGGFINVRPFPSDLAKVVIGADGLVLTGSQQKAIYEYSFQGFKGKAIVGADDKQLAFSDEVKSMIWQYKLGGIPDLVIRKSREYEAAKKAQEKN